MNDKIYKAEFADESFEVYHSESDALATYEACQLEKEKNSILISVEELDNDYNSIRIVF